MIIGIVIWIVLALLIASVGDNRKIGYMGALVISVLFSPLIGLLVVLLSGKKELNKAYNGYKNKFRQNLAEADKAKYKKDYKLSIDKYYDAAWELENSFSNLKGKEKIEKEEKLKEIKKIIENLKEINSTSYHE